MSKLTFIQIEEAYRRNVCGEPIRKIARELAVTEGALRHHFRKSIAPTEVRRIALALFQNEQRLNQLCKTDREVVHGEVSRRTRG